MISPAMHRPERTLHCSSMPDSEAKRGDVRTNFVGIFCSIFRDVRPDFSREFDNMCHVLVDWLKLQTNKQYDHDFLTELSRFLQNSHSFCAFWLIWGNIVFFMVHLGITPQEILTRRRHVTENISIIAHGSVKW